MTGFLGILIIFFTVQFMVTQQRFTFSERNYEHLAQTRVSEGVLAIGHNDGRPPQVGVTVDRETIHNIKPPANIRQYKLPQWHTNILLLTFRSFYCQL